MGDGFHWRLSIKVTAFLAPYCVCVCCLGAAHATQEKFENAAFFSSVGPTNPSRKESFSKTLFKPVEFENAGFEFSGGQKAFWKQ